MRKPHTSPHDNVAEERREVVASLVLRKLSQRSIARELERVGMVNPDTQLPWDVMTINRDIQALRKRWAANQMRDAETYFGAMWAEYEEAKKAAYEAGEIGAVLRALDSQRDMIGLVAAKKLKVDVDWKQELEKSGVKASDLFEQMVQAASGLITVNEGGE